MDLATLITTCAVAAHANVSPLLYQIGHLHDGDPYAIEVIDQSKLYRPQSADEAVALTTRLLEEGHHLRVGLAQLCPRRAFEQYEIPIATLLGDHCHHIQIAADRLQGLLQEHRSIEPALSAYYAPTDDPLHEGGRLWTVEVLRQPLPTDTESHELPRRYDIPSDRLFVDTGEREQPTHTTGDELFSEPDTSSQTSEPVSSESVESLDTVWSESLQRSDGYRPQPNVTDATLPTTEELTE